MNVLPGLKTMLVIGILLNLGLVDRSWAFDYDAFLERIEPTRISRDRLLKDVSKKRQAFLDLVAEAEAGDPQAQHQLGLCLRDGCREYLGLGLAPTLTGEAAWWFAQAARSGHAPARVELARTKVPEALYRYHMADGKQVETRTDIQTLTAEEKLEILKTALDEGYRKALSEIERVEREQAADLRHEAAYREREEKLSVLEDQFAETGNPELLFQIGSLYRNGYSYTHSGHERVVKPGQNEPAARYFKRAAELGHGPSIIELGILYEHGWGVEENMDTALNLYVLAESEGVPGAAERIAYVERKIRVPIERKKRMALLIGLVAAAAVALSDDSGSPGNTRSAWQDDADRIRKDTNDFANQVMFLDLYKHSAF